MLLHGPAQANPQAIVQVQTRAGLTLRGERASPPPPRAPAAAPPLPPLPGTCSATAGRGPPCTAAASARGFRRGRASSGRFVRALGLLAGRRPSRPINTASLGLRPRSRPACFAPPAAQPPAHLGLRALRLLRVVRLAPPAAPRTACLGLGLEAHGRLGLEVQHLLGQGLEGAGGGALVFREGGLCTHQFSVGQPPQT